MKKRVELAAGLVKMKEFTLPELPYAYDALEPYYDKETLTIHHDKHHAGYVKGVNTAMKKLAEARISLISAVKIVLKNGLSILGVEAPDKM